MAEPAGGADRTFVRRVLFVLAAVALVFLAWRLATVLLLVFGAVIVAVLLRSLADPIRDRTPLNDSLSLVAAALIIVGALGGAGWRFGATVSAQIEQLSETLPQSVAALRAQVAQLSFGPELLAQLEGPGAFAADLGGIAGHIGGYALTVFGAGVDLLVVIFAGVYFATSPSKYRDGLLKLAPHGPREALREAVNASGRALRLWLLGTLLSMIVVGVLTGLGAWALGLSSPIALGLFAGLAAFVPIVGPIISVIPGVMVAATGGPQLILWTLLMYFAVQQVESNVTYPMIQGRTVDLPPVLTLFAVLALGALLGPLGVVFATPLAVVVYVLVKILYVRNTLGEETTVPGDHGN